MDSGAQRRGLINWPSAADALPHLCDEKNVALFERHGVFTPAELKSRQEIYLGQLREGHQHRGPHHVGHGEAGTSCPASSITRQAGQRRPDQKQHRRGQRPGNRPVPAALPAGPAGAGRRSGPAPGPGPKPYRPAEYRDNVCPAMDVRARRWTAPSPWCPPSCGPIPTTAACCSASGNSVSLSLAFWGSACGSRVAPFFQEEGVSPQRQNVLLYFVSPRSWGAPRSNRLRPWRLPPGPFQDVLDKSPFASRYFSRPGSTGASRARDSSASRSPGRLRMAVQIVPKANVIPPRLAILQNHVDKMVCVSPVPW